MLSTDWVSVDSFISDAKMKCSKCSKIETYTATAALVLGLVTNAPCCVLLFCRYIYGKTNSHLHRRT